MSDITYEGEPHKQPGHINEREQVPFLEGVSARVGLQPNQIYYILIGVSVIFTLFILLTVRGSSYPVTETGKRLYVEDIPADARRAIPPEILKQIPSRYGN